MKKVISWVSFFTIAFAVVMFCMWCGAQAANFVAETFHLHGWWLFFPAIVLLVVAVSVECFLILGLKKFGES